MPNAKKVTTGKPQSIGGAIYFALIDANLTLPTDVDSALTGFTELGYASEDGIKNSNSVDTDTVKAWGGDTVLRTLNGKDDTFTFTLIEAMNEEVLKLVYGEANVTVDSSTGEISVKSNSKEAKAHAFVFDMILKGGAKKRIVIPSATITEVGEISYTDSDPVAYETTIGCEPDSTGNTHYEYIKPAQ